MPDSFEIHSRRTIDTVHIFPPVTSTFAVIRGWTVFPCAISFTDF
jgi:hypothetical protein